MSATFHGDGISAIDSKSGLVIGRPYGCLGILWRKSLNIDIDIVKYDNENRLMSARIATPTSQICVLNVYLPTVCYENLHKFNFICTKYIRYLIITVRPTLWLN